MNSPPVSTAAAPPRLHRRLGFLQATALNMSNMIGIGPFLTIPLLMSALNGGGPQAMLGWIVALVISLADGMVWAELGAAYPGSGGSYIYLREGFGRETAGRLMAFLFIWQFILSGPLEIASGYIGFKQYFKYLWPNMGAVGSIALILGIGALNIFLLFRRIGSIGKITVGLWLGAMLTTFGVILAGAFHFDAKLAFDFPKGAFDFSGGFPAAIGFCIGLGAASQIGVYDYLGYYDVCYIGEEVREPAKVIPRSILFSILGVGVIYLAMNFSIIGVVPWREFVPADGNPKAQFVASLFMEKLYGSRVASAFTLMVLWTAFASCFALLLGYSRIPYAAAQDGGFFKIFGRLHPSKDFPHISLVVMGLIAIGCSFLPLDAVISALMTTRILVQFIGQIAAVALLRRRNPGSPGRMWLYPLPSIIALTGWIFIFATSGMKFILWGVGTLLAGLCFYVVWARSAGLWPFKKDAEAAAAG